MGRKPEEESADRVKADEANGQRQTAADQAASSTRTAADDKQVAGDLAVDDARQIVRDAEQRGQRTAGPAPDVRKGLLHTAAVGMASIADSVKTTVRGATGRETPAETPAARGASRHEEARRDNAVVRAPAIKPGFA
ncbi:MAG: hypothetical protein HOV66_09340 [Streptomycetaceae bacterium]|jgi:hypothetical protein|nr:hypothetical protein [Streptomycetaceae bacterium]NUS55050.1 hypothetical protein [Streptomycetaceae bacterium]